VKLSFLGTARSKVGLSEVSMADAEALQLPFQLEKHPSIL
jgi:hypothetical protein